MSAVKARVYRWLGLCPVTGRRRCPWHPDGGNHPARADDMGGRPVSGLTGGIEPGQVGTRIEDGRGRRWVRVHPAGGPAPWWLVDADEHSDAWAVWSAIPEPTYVLAADDMGSEE